MLTHRFFALSKELLAGFEPQVGMKQTLPGAVSVDYGYVTLNYDKAWFTQHKLALPTSLDELTRPAYKCLLQVC